MPATSPLFRNHTYIYIYSETRITLVRMHFTVFYLYIYIDFV